MMAAILKNKCSKWSFPKLKDFLKHSEECQKAVEKKVEELEKRMATMDGEEEWMDHSSRFEEYTKGL